MLKSKLIWHETEALTPANLTEDIHPQIQQLMAKRGLTGLEASHDPLLMKAITKSVARISQAITNKEPILVYGDYDADGIAATALLVRCLKKLGGVVNYYIPNRFYEGYGPNEGAFMQAIADGYQLIITVDCGITAITEADLLATHNVDLIITDHHQPKAELPKALAIIHPELEPDYPFKALAGVGVALKLASALTNSELTEDDYLIAMLGTIGDMVSLVDENRWLAKRGLKALKETALPGIKSLLKMAKIPQLEANEITVGYDICPRLNAPGRLDDADVSVQLLLTADEEEAMVLARQIESLNEERKTLTQQTTDEALALIDEATDKKVLILHQSQWHEGILGIVAGKLARQLNRAIILLTDDHEGLGKGSGRAPSGYDLFELLTANQDLVLKFGGHAQAVGLTLNPEHIAALEQGMNELLQDQEIQSSLTIDLTLPLPDANLDFIQQMQHLAPFGESNRPPVIKLQMSNVKNVKKIGNKSQHLKFTITDQTHDLEAVAFNQGNLAMYLTPETNFDFVGELQINEWNGHRRPQFLVTDLRCDEFQLIDLRGKGLFDQFKQEALNDGENLVIDKLPESIESLLANIKKARPHNVILKPYDPVTFAARDKFVSVYKIVKQHTPFTLNEQVIHYFKQMGVPKNEVLFILKVFFEVELVIIEGATVSLGNPASKRDLSEAPTYQAQKSKQAVFEFLELNSGLELKKMISEAIEKGE